MPPLSRTLLAALLATGPALASSAAAQQGAAGGASGATPPFGRPTVRVVVGVAGGTPFVEDANGTTVRPGLAPVVGVEGASRIAPRTSLTLGLRASRPSASVEFDGGGASDVDGGGVTTVDVVLGVERELRRVFTVRGGAGLLYLHGPSELAPFRFNNGSSVRPLVDVGGDVRLGGRIPLAIALSWQGFRYGAATAADPIEESGVVQRLLVGVRYGR